jgi:hypothetical protein
VSLVARGYQGVNLSELQSSGMKIGIYVANAADREGESATATSAADGDVQLADASKNPRDTSTCAVRTTDLTQEDLRGAV